MRASVAISRSTDSEVINARLRFAGGAVGFISRSTSRLFAASKVGPDRKKSLRFDNPQSAPRYLSALSVKR